MRLAIVSTPRAGNTYLRMMLAHLYKLAEQGYYTPDEVPWAQLPERVIFLLHWPPAAEFRASLARHGVQPVVIARHPLDVLASILRFAQHSPDTHNWIGGAGGDERDLRGATPTSRAFLDYALGPRGRALLSVTADWWNVPGVARLQYEKLVADPEGAMAALVGELGIETVEPVPEVVAKYTPDFVRDYWKKYNHVWRARPDAWRELITQDRALVIRARHADVFQTLGYACDLAHDLTEEQAEANWTRMRKTVL